MPYILVVDGVISSGKSTLISECLVPGLTEAGYRVHVVAEPVDKWRESGLLSRYYSDIKTNAYLFQTQAFHDRVRACQDAWKFRNETDVFLLERSVLSDRLFVEMLREDGLFDDLLYKCYNDWWGMWNELIPFTPSLFLYVKTSVTECMKRIAKRARPGEEGITAEYETRLLAQHERFFGGESVLVREGVSRPCMHLINEVDYRESDVQRRNIVDAVLQKLKSLPRTEDDSG